MYEGLVMDYFVDRCFSYIKLQEPGKKSNIAESLNLYDHVDCISRSKSKICQNWALVFFLILIITDQIYSLI